MNKPTNRVSTHESQQPQDQKYHKDGPQHGDPSFQTINGFLDVGSLYFKKGQEINRYKYVFLE
jgi:hypothetical protein